MTHQDVDPTTIVDLQSYPLDHRGGRAYRELLRARRDELERRQFCTLDGFMRPAARRLAAEQAISVIGEAHRARSQRNVYLERQPTPELGDDHPRNIFAPASYRMIGSHLLPRGAVVKGLYHWDPFRQLIADLVGESELFPSADPYQPVNVICYSRGDRSAWHFDSDNAFTITLMLQAPRAGGRFEIVPNVRTETDPGVEELRRVLRGDRARVQTMAREEGSLVVFRGCHSPHRVTPVEGERMRLMCVMVYEREPGLVGDPVVNETVYGVRAAARPA